MRLIFYIFLIIQLLNFLGVFAEKVKEDLSGGKTIIWEKVEENKSKPLKKIIWKFYKGDENLHDMHEKTSDGNIFTTLCHLNHSFPIQNTSREDTALP